MIFTWNCRGLGSPRVVLSLHELVKKHKLDVIFLIETLINRNKLADIGTKLGYKGVFEVERLGRGG